MALHTDDVAFFLHMLSFFVDYVFLLIMSMFFFAHTCIFYMFIIRYCMFSAYCDMYYWSWVDSFAIYMHILHICSTSKRWDGRNCAKNFGISRVSGLNKKG